MKLRVHRLGRTLADVSWPSPRKERKLVAEFLHEKVRATEKIAHELDLNDVEHGLHELRRRLRWLSIYAAALDGAVQLDHAAKPPRNWNRYLTPAVVNNPFNDLPKGDGSIKPVLLPAPLFYALSWTIAELGSLKDRAQWTETVTHGLEAVGVAGAKPKKWLGDLTLEAREAGKHRGEDPLRRQAPPSFPLLQPPSPSPHLHRGEGGGVHREGAAHGGAERPARFANDRHAGEHLGDARSPRAEPHHVGLGELGVLEQERDHVGVRIAEHAVEHPSVGLAREGLPLAEGQGRPRP